MGNSKRDELALLLGAAYPEGIRVDVGYVPSGVVWQEPSFDLQTVRCPRTSWSLRGNPVPFVRFVTPHFSKMVGTLGLFTGRPMTFRPLYERSRNDEEAVADGSIAVEKIVGPVLLISGIDEQVWSSARLSEMVIEGLEEHNYTLRYEHLRYEVAGHLTIIGFAVEAKTKSSRRVKLRKQGS